jgi:hypothetical protein
MQSAVRISTGSALVEAVKTKNNNVDKTIFMS